MKKLILAVALLPSLVIAAPQGNWKSRLDDTNTKAKIIERKFSAGTDVGVAYQTIHAQCQYEISTELNEFGKLDRFELENTTVVGSELINTDLLITVVCFARKK